jgi:hypothetical protein
MVKRAHGINVEVDPGEQRHNQLDHEAGFELGVQ